MVVEERVAVFQVVGVRSTTNTKTKLTLVGLKYPQITQYEENGCRLFLDTVEEKDKSYLSILVGPNIEKRNDEMT